MTAPPLSVAPQDVAPSVEIDVVSGAEQAAVRLQERLRVGARMLQAFQVQLERAESPPASVVATSGMRSRSPAFSRCTSARPNWGRSTS